MQLFKYLILIFLFNSSVLAINVGQVEIDYPYGRETSDNEACALAELKLQDKARQKAGGEESISAESFKVCKGSENENQCNYYTNSFHSIGSYQIVDYEPIKTDGKFCIFSDGNKDIKIVSRKGNFIIQKLPDQSSNFDFRITLSNNEFVSHPLNTSKDLLKKNESVKILSKGDYNIKLNITAHQFSNTAKNIVEKYGGEVLTIEEIKKEDLDVKVKKKDIKVKKEKSDSKDDKDLVDLKDKKSKEDDKNKNKD